MTKPLDIKLLADKVARFLEPDIMSHTTSVWEWRQDQERKYALRLLEETGIVAALRASIERDGL